MLMALTYSIHRGVRVNFFFTSQPFIHQSYVANKAAFKHQISIDDNQRGYSDDIQKFIRDRVDQITENRQFDLGGGLFYDESGPSQSAVCDSLASRFPFCEYASLYWAEHFALCADAAPLDLIVLVKSVLDTDTACYRNWVRFHRTRAAISMDDEAYGWNLVVLASQYNADVILQELLGHSEPSQAIKNRSLYRASRSGHHHIVESMLRAGADPNSKELERQTSLTAAAEQGNLTCVKSLLADPQTDINVPGRKGRTALSFACGDGHNEIASLLLSQHSCFIDKPDDSGVTPFFWAVGGGYHSTVSILARHPKVDMNQRDKAGRTALS